MNNIFKNNIFKTLSIIAISLNATSCIAPVLAVGGASLLGYSAVQERSVGDAIDDASIETKIEANFLNHDEALFVHVSADSVEGRVLLLGSVPNAEAKKLAYDLAWDTTGVREVMNEIMVNEVSEITAKQFAKDSWITTQVESKLLFTKNIKSPNYSVETVNGVVYLLGVAQNKDELDTAAGVASTVNGVKRVVSHIRMKDSKYRLPTPKKPTISNSGNSASGNASSGNVSNNNMNNNYETTTPGSIRKYFDGSNTEQSSGSSESENSSEFVVPKVERALPPS